MLVKVFYHGSFILEVDGDSFVVQFVFDVVFVFHVMLTRGCLFVVKSRVALVDSWPMSLAVPSKRDNHPESLHVHPT